MNKSAQKRSSDISNVFPLRPYDASSGELHARDVDVQGTIANTPSVEPHMTTCVSAHLPLLPDPLKLKHGPLLVTLETWSDGTVVARIPALALYADGESDTLALDELGEEILDFASSTKRFITTHEVRGGPLLQQWKGLLELVDITGLPG